MQHILDYFKVNNIKYHANDNISDYITEDDLQKIEYNVEEIINKLLSTLLIDTKNDPNSMDTPKRVAKMLVHETLVGRFTSCPKITVFPNSSNLDEVMYTKCEVKSMCSHHMQPIIGHCFIGIQYNDFLMGLSKFDRIVDWFARRGQIQEEMTVQIADYIESIVSPQALGIVIKAEHFCKICRGVKQDGEMITSVMRGDLRTSPQMKSEFLTMIQMMK